MCNSQCISYVAQAINKHGARGDVLEVGSLDDNGSVRPLFSDRQRFPSYTGVDRRLGPGVDIQMVASALTFPNQKFNIVVTTEMLEHDPRFWVSIAEFHRVLQPRGLVIITARNVGYHKHGIDIGDYWRFTTEGLAATMEWGGFRVLEVEDEPAEYGVHGTGRRET